ncbi:hypothetical protein OZX65_07000 [Leuconostocaceae bacterium ESL0723]|nr:hypothetical protein OZX65_07000 [Leuconostocaceae bacterium ESL0723]
MADKENSDLPLDHVKSKADIYPQLGKFIAAEIGINLGMLIVNVRKIGISHIFDTKAWHWPTIGLVLGIDVVLVILVYLFLRLWVKYRPK